MRGVSARVRVSTCEGCVCTCEGVSAHVRGVLQWSSACASLLTGGSPPSAVCDQFPVGVPLCLCLHSLPASSCLHQCSATAGTGGHVSYPRHTIRGGTPGGSCNLYWASNMPECLLYVKCVLPVRETRVLCFIRWAILVTQ